MVSNRSSDSSSANEESDFDEGADLDPEDIKTPVITNTPEPRQRKPRQQPINKPSRFDKPTSTGDTDPHRVTLQNYEECDLDEAALDELLATKNRKTSNRLPPDVQRELKNIQMWYRRMKKIFALIGHCSEQTVNDFL